MNKTAIDWADYTWNPVTGCRRGCKYCYAKKIHDRFYPTVPFSEITFHPERLNQPALVKKPSIVFVGSMSDIEYWMDDWTEQIISVCRENSQHTFMFLSKGPFSYKGHIWPENTMQGLTMEAIGDSYGGLVLQSFLESSPRPFLSLEPLQGSVMPLIQLNSIDKLERVIVGAMTGPGAVAPKEEWVRSVMKNVPEEILFWKENILKLYPRIPHTKG